MFTRIYKAIERRRYHWFNRRQRYIDFTPGTISFTFDDFPATAAQLGAELLERQGWRGTFYLSPGLMDKETAVGFGCSWQDVERLHRGGHEIANHTYSHIPCQGARRLNLRREFQSSMKALERFNGGRNFALPYGVFDDASLNFFSGRFDTIRTVGRGVNHGDTDLNLLKANPIDQSSDQAGLRSLIEQTRTDGGWLIFFTHDICLAPSRFGCTPEHFQTVLDWVKDAGLAVRTVAQTYKLLNTLSQTSSGQHMASRAQG